MLYICFNGANMHVWELIIFGVSPNKIAAEVKHVTKPTMQCSMHEQTQYDIWNMSFVLLSAQLNIFESKKIAKNITTWVKQYYTQLWHVGFFFKKNLWPVHELFVWLDLVIAIMVLSWDFLMLFFLNFLPHEYVKCVNNIKYDRPIWTLTWQCNDRLFLGV